MKGPAYKEILEQNRRLREENARLRKELAQKEQRIESLQSLADKRQQEIDRLKAELQAAQRAGKRQAAPFSKGPLKTQPKRPGRKAGAAHGRHGHRPAPPVIDEHHTAPLPDACPDCGGQVRLDRVEKQYQVDLPQRPIYREFQVQIGHCEHCGARVQGRHELQTSDALGAAASQLGPTLQATIVFLHKRLGVAYGKIARLVRELFGIEVSRGGVAQAALRAGRRLEAAYEQIGKKIRASPWAAADETGWRVGGRSCWLHTLSNDQATWYTIDPSRSAEAAARVLGWSWSGTLIHDGWSSYDRFRCAEHQQCAYHPLHRAHELLRQVRGAAVRWLREVIRLFQTALSVRDLHEQGQLDENDLADAYLSLTVELERLCESRKTHPELATFSAHLLHHIWNWFWFLLTPGLEATNRRGEQALRFGVVNRKVWGGNRTENGAQAQSVEMSVIATCDQQGHSPLVFIRDALCSPSPLLIPGL